MPKNSHVWKEIHFPNHHFSVSMLNFGGVYNFTFFPNIIQPIAEPSASSVACPGLHRGAKFNGPNKYSAILIPTEHVSRCDPISLRCSPKREFPQLIGFGIDLHHQKGQLETSQNMKRSPYFFRLPLYGSSWFWHQIPHDTWLNLSS